MFSIGNSNSKMTKNSPTYLQYLYKAKHCYFHSIGHSLSPICNLDQQNTVTNNNYKENRSMNVVWFKNKSIWFKNEAECAKIMDSFHTMFFFAFHLDHAHPS